MKVLFQFDVSASSYEIKQELSSISSWPGVTSAVLLEKVSGDAPYFCLEVDVADGAAEGFRERSKAMQSQYSSYVYNMREIVYRTT